jgi:cell wall assembly regulator SMI1
LQAKEGILLTEDSWYKFEAVLQKFMPRDYAALMPPASDEQIQAAELAMGVVFPDDLKFLYRKHNGIDRNAKFVGNFVFDGMRWCSLDDMVAYWKMMSHLCDQWQTDYPDHFPKENASWENLMVRPVSYDKKWIPISLSGSMHNIYLDLSPSYAGTVGQIVHLSSDGGVIAMAPSLADWIDFFCDSFESGELALNEDSQWMDMRTGTPKHIGLRVYWSFHPDKLKPGVKTTLE